MREIDQLQQTDGVASDNLAAELRELLNGRASGKPARAQAETRKRRAARRSSSASRKKNR